jgi:aminopeptidase-like protein
MMRNVIAYSNGKRTLLEIAQKINKPIWELQGIVQRLMEENILLCVGD